MVSRYWLIGASALFVIAPLYGPAAQQPPSSPAFTATVGSPQVGMSVFSIDGQKIGAVESTNTSDGKGMVLWG
jgi:hypothetical protein